MGSRLALISLNVERHKHIDLVVAFLRERQPDVVCLQELFESDIPAIEEAIGGTSFFVPSNLYSTPGGTEVEGVGIFSRLPFTSTKAIRYAGYDGEPVMFAETEDPVQKFAAQTYSLAIAGIMKDSTPYRVITTHFPWTPNGEADDIQRESLSSMLSILEGEGEFVLCGDFNAPRGKEIFAKLAQTYRDNVPASYESSLDDTHHRRKGLVLMVDGLFTTPGYEAHDVALLSGVSDHCALVGTITKPS